jgi:hypothetical protein
LSLPWSPMAAHYTAGGRAGGRSGGSSAAIRRAGERGERAGGGGWEERDVCERERRRDLCSAAAPRRHPALLYLLREATTPCYTASPSDAGFLDGTASA